MLYEVLDVLRAKLISNEEETGGDAAVESRSI